MVRERGFEYVEFQRTAGWPQVATLKAAKS